MNELENAFQSLYAAITEHHHAVCKLYELIGRAEASKHDPEQHYIGVMKQLIIENTNVVEESSANLAQARREYEALVRDTFKEPAPCKIQK